MPSYTHLRRAQPVLAAHFFLAHAAALRRDHARLAAARDEADELPLGSGAIAGTSYPSTSRARARWASAASSANSIDATGDRDFVASFLYASALTMVHLSRLAEDVILFTSEEFGFFELADTVATGSSLMPQKKNPDPLELVRGKSGRVDWPSAGWLATMKGLPIGYSKDLQEDKEAAVRGGRHRWPRRLDDDRRRRAHVDAAIDRHAPRPRSGLLLATEVADYLVPAACRSDRARDHRPVVRDLYEARSGFPFAFGRRLAALRRAFRDGHSTGVDSGSRRGARLTPEAID